MSDKKTVETIQEPTFYILLSLRGGEKHGYAILKEVEELSEGRIRLSTGTLYGALNRLLDQQLIEQIVPEDPSRGKRTYRLTLAGLKVFAVEVNRMQSLLNKVQQQKPAENGRQI